MILNKVILLLILILLILLLILTIALTGTVFKFSRVSRKPSPLDDPISSIRRDDKEEDTTYEHGTNDDINDVQEEPIQEEPIQEEPIQEEPVQEEAVQEEPVQDYDDDDDDDDEDVNQSVFVDIHDHAIIESSDAW